MIDLTDCTFTIPVRIESEDRKRNLIIVIDYLCHHFNTHILICEQDSKSHVKEMWKPQWSANNKVQLIFLEDLTPAFHKTRCLNEMVSASKTSFLISHDSDVLLFPEHYENAAKMLRLNQLDFCYPFNQPLHHIAAQHIEDIKIKYELNVIIGKTTIFHSSPPPGGCFFINKQKFIQAGREDENFCGYGSEDISRLILLQRLGYRIAYLPGILYHLEHIKTGSSAEQHDFKQQNENEFNKIKHLPIELLKLYIKSWSWNKNV